MGPDLVASRLTRFAFAFLPLGTLAFRALQREASWAVDKKDKLAHTRVADLSEELVARGVELMMKVGSTVALSIGSFVAPLTQKWGGTGETGVKQRTQHAETDVVTKAVQAGMNLEFGQVCQHDAEISAKVGQGFWKYLISVPLAPARACTSNSTSFGLIDSTRT